MVEAWSIRAGLYAILAAAAFVTAGCSTVATVPADADTQDDEALVEEVELDPAVTKVDEADIGVSGPEQIEEAIETLDAQTQSSPPLVSSSGGVSTAPAVGDLFERIRSGFVIEDVDHDAIDREERWFANHPAYLDRTFKRGERYLYHIVKQIEARKMPLELALLPVVESAFNPVAYSRARASGLWQFIPGTGRRYDLKQNCTTTDDATSSWQRTQRSTTCSSSRKNSMATGCSPSRPTTAAKATSREPSRATARPASRPTSSA